MGVRQMLISAVGGKRVNWGVDGWMGRGKGVRLRGGLNVGLAIRRGVVVVVVREGWAWMMWRRERSMKRKIG